MLEPTARATGLSRANRDGEAVTRLGSCLRHVVVMWHRASRLCVPIGSPAPFSLPIPDTIACYTLRWLRIWDVTDRQSARLADPGQPGNGGNCPLPHIQILKSP